MRILVEGDGLGGVADADVEARLAGGDREALVAQLAHDVERFARLLLEREPQRVRRDLLLDGLAHVRRGAEEPVRGHEAVERLVRALEVVVREEVLESALRVDEVREHGASEELVPQRLPEPLDLAERLRVLRPAPDVRDAVPGQRLLELGLAAPHRVLPAVVGQHLGRLAVRREAAFERLHHERRLLVVCDRVADDEPAVVVHEHAQVEPLLPALQEREDVGLPQLVRRRAFEPPRRVLALGHRRWRRDESLFMEDATHLGLRHAERLEPREHVADPPRAPLSVLLLERHHAFPRERRR